MKTIFITSFNPFIGRNILSTETLNRLAGTVGLKVIIFCPAYKLNYFKENFASDNVVIEGVATEITSKQDIIFSYIGRSLISTKTLAVHRLEIFLRNKNIITFFFSYFLAALGRLDKIKSFVRWLDFATINKSKSSFYFDKYQPDLIFATDVFHSADIYFLAEAKKRDVMSVGMVRSWDNITNKGLFRVKPDKLIVHNNIVREEAVKYEDMDLENIFVSGLPQFDIYLEDIIIPRDIFFKRIGLNPSRKIILVAPHGRRFHKTDWELLEILKNKLDNNFQFIVRFPPNDTVEFNEFVPDKRFFIERPGKEFGVNKFNEREVQKTDAVTLANNLFYSDVVVNYGSTISMDAVVFDKPVIIVAFDGWEKLPYIKSVRRFLDYDHIKKLICTGFCKIAHKEEDLVSHIHNYINNPSCDGENRKRLLHEQVWKFDGQSGQRIAEYVCQLVLS